MHKLNIDGIYEPYLFFDKLATQKDADTVIYRNIYVLVALTTHEYK